MWQLATSNGKKISYPPSNIIFYLNVSNLIKYRRLRKKTHKLFDISYFQNILTNN